LVVLLFWLSAASSGQTDRINVFVSAPTRNGFVDTTKEIQDSVKNVRTKLSHMKEFQLVDGRNGAEIVLTIVSRGVGSTAYGQRVTYTEGYYTGATLESGPMVANTYWVSTVMEVEQYRKEFLGRYTHEYSSSMGAWTICADQIAKNLKSWIQANREQLKQPGVPSSSRLQEAQPTSMPVSPLVKGQVGAPNQLMPLPVAEKKHAPSTESADNVGTVSVTCNPDGAEIFIDSIGTGRAPAILKLKPGEHSVQLVLHGYRDWSSQVTVKGNSIVNVSANLEK